MAELELSGLERRCRNRRRGDRAALAPAGGGWVARRSAATATIRWPFTTADARTTRHRPYPAFEP